MNDDGMMYGPWRPTGEIEVGHIDVATVLKGMGSVPVQTVRTPVYRHRERRKVWKFVGYEERTVES